MTDDLAAFITARLDEDEAAAKAALRGPWSIAENEVWGTQIIAIDGSPVMPVYVEGVTSAALSTAVHIARHDPARVLREAAAKRAILALHNRTHECSVSSLEHHPEKGEWLYISTEYVDEDGPEWPCTTLRHLAAIWSDHPDYRAEWLP